MASLKDAMEVITSIEEHTGEKLECSRRFKFLLASKIQRMMTKHQVLKYNIQNLLEGDHNATFNSNTHSTRRKPHTKQS